MKSKLVVRGSREIYKKSTDGEICVEFSSKEDLRSKARKLVGVKWRHVMSIEDEDVIYEAQSIYDQSFDTIDDVVQFVYKS